MVKHLAMNLGRYADGGNLYLYISPGGTKSWVVRFRQNGRRVDRGLGSFPKVPLPKARLAAAACMKREPALDVDNDDAPVTLAPGAVPTFREAAMLKHALKVDSGEIANAKSARNWLQVMDRHTFPVLGDKPVDQVTRRDVIAVLEPIWRNLPETAKRVRHRTREVMAWAVGRDYLTNAAFLELDPAGVGVTDALGKRRHKATHFASMPYGDVSHAIAAIEMSRGIREVRLALRLLILTAEPIGRGSRDALGRIERRPHGLDHPRRAHEGRTRAPHPLERAGPPRVARGRGGGRPAAQAEARL